jgi:antitoxin component YwqK of YwqJK toxin-antitoxin module
MAQLTHVIKPLKNKSGKDIGTLAGYIDEKDQWQGDVRQNNHDGTFDVVPYKDNKIEGVKKSYLDDGTLYQQETYKDGVLNGPFKRIYRKSVETGQYVVGVLDGVVAEERTEDKFIIERTSYNKGIIQSYEHWYANGQKQDDVKYDHLGRLLTKENFHSNGNVLLSIEVDPEAKIKKTKTYFVNGRLRSSYQEKNSKREGWSVTYLNDAEHTVMRRMFHVNGKGVVNPESEEDARKILYLENKGYTVQAPEDKASPAIKPKTKNLKK